MSDNCREGSCFEPLCARHTCTSPVYKKCPFAFSVHKIAAFPDKLGKAQWGYLAKPDLILQAGASLGKSRLVILLMMGHPELLIYLLQESAKKTKPKGGNMLEMQEALT